MVEKMAKWKYDPNELKRKALEALLKAVTQRWSNIVKIERDIREQIMKSVMPHFTKEEVKKAMIKSESRQTHSFKYFKIDKSLYHN